MPEEGVEKLWHTHILSFEEFARLVKIATRVGIRKIRLTGGEPLVRKNVSQLISYISEIPEIDDIAITTNGTLFAPMAEELKKAGLQRVNISIDSMVSEKFNYITRRGNLADVKKAILKALELDMHPVKLNVVVINGFNDGEINDFAKLAYEYPLHIRFIEFMPIGDLVFWEQQRIITTKEMRAIIEKEYSLTDGPRITGNGPAKYYYLKGGQGTLGFISPMSNHFCSQCNRIRMTADGRLRGCLYDKREIDLQDALKKGAGDEELKQLFIKVIKMKPEKHHMNDGWGKDNRRKMYQIGG
jgi:cyclic pyranopterin phosphate synthase